MRCAQRGSCPATTAAAFTPERVGLLTLLAIVVTFRVHSLIDFTWFVPGNALPALVAAGSLAGGARFPTEAPRGRLKEPPA